MEFLPAVLIAQLVLPNVLLIGRKRMVLHESIPGILLLELGKDGREHVTRALEESVVIGHLTLPFFDVFSSRGRFESVHRSKGLIAIDLGNDIETLHHCCAIHLKDRGDLLPHKSSGRIDVIVAKENQSMLDILQSKSYTYIQKMRVSMNKRREI